MSEYITHPTQETITTNAVYTKVLITKLNPGTTMSKEKSSAFMAIGVMGILGESFRIPFRMGKLSISLALFLIVASSIIYIGNVFVLKPLLMDLVLKSYYLQNSVIGTPQFEELVAGIAKDVRVIVSREVIFILADHIVSLLTIVATIYASAVTYSGKQLSFKDSILRMRSAWKRPLITWLCIILFKTGYLFVLVFLTVFLATIAQGSVLLVALAILIVLCGLLYHLYLVVNWNLGLVISVVEDGYQGFSAFGKVWELINGRKLQAFGLSLVFTIATMAISWILGLQMRNAKYSETTHTAIGLILVDLSCLMTLYSTVVFTVFYYVCKQSKGEEVEVLGINTYSLVPTTTHVDASVP
ncbi:uncharacterized protein [Aristolochia californica]|uniref:uncharacterized protein n=1 Tax=Aristolochia californica TaxID=171875 RepID=UPI0035E30EA8